MLNPNYSKKAKPYPLYSWDQTMQRLKCAPSTLDELVRSGHIRRVNLGKNSRLVRFCWVDAYIAQHGVLNDDESVRYEQLKALGALQIRGGKFQSVKRRKNQADFERFYREQRGCCALCGKDIANYYVENCAGAKAAFDHCHRTGRWRGVLCIPCNCALGHVERWDFDVLADYLYGRSA